MDMGKVRDGYKETEIGVIPVEWEVDYIDRVAQRYSGHTPNKKNQSYWNGDIPWISLKDISKLDKRYISETTDRTTIDGINNSSAILLPKGTVVISRDATIGKIGILDSDMATSQHFINYVCGESVNNEYLYYHFFYRKNEFERIAIGSTIKTIGLQYFKSLRIVIPPLQEQQHIAEILSTTDEHIEKLDKTIEDYQLLKKGMMKKLLTEGIGHTEFKETEIGRIPKEWKVKKLCDIAEICYGKNQKKVEIENGKYKILGTGGVIGSTDTYLWDKPSVLIGRKGTINKPMYIEEPFWTVDTLFYTKVKENYLAKWLYYFLNYVNLSKYNEATGVPSLNTTTLNSIKVPLPLLAEQQQIASILSEIDNKIDQYQQQRQDFTQLKKALMEQLLTGKIRVKQ